MECFRGHAVTDLYGRHIFSEIRQPGVAQPLECGWRNGLLKIRQNGTPQEAGIDLNLCARAASTHVDPSAVFVRSVRTLWRS
jgi:hypothetical protein